ncbi:MAG TPA: hypothetical protein VNZ22_03160 [Bacillota bacterium]|nr:hypothetical protein [Bacillota bacterium]
MQFLALALTFLATFASLRAAEPATLFRHCPTNEGWVTVWDSEWTQPANDAGQRVDNGSQLILAQPATKGNYSFSLLAQTPWGSQKHIHTIRLPEGMKGGYTDQVVWSMAEGKGRGPLSWDRALASKGDLYLGFYVRFRGSGGRPYRLENLGGQKMLYARPAPEPGSGTFAHIFIRKGGTPLGGGWAGFEPQPMHTVCESAAYFTEPSSPIGIDDRWNQIEYRIIANTRTKTNHLADGQVEIYVDGTLQHRQTNAIIYCTGQESATMNSFSLNPIYGGGTNPVPYDLYVDYGRMKVMAR